MVYDRVKHRRGSDFHDFPQPVFGVSSQAANRVLRGGGWNNNAENCRSANRNNNSPGYRYAGFGFRLVRLPAHRARRMPAR